MRKRLSDLTVARMSEPGETWDTLLPSFGIRIGKRVKVFQVAIRRPGEKNPTRHKLGAFPDLSVAEARTKARKVMAGDGVANLAARLSGLIDPFLEHGRTRRGRPIRPETKRVYRQVLQVTAKPLHHRPVSEIRRRDIAALLAKVERDKGAAMAALTRKTLGRFWSWMLETDQADASPVVGTPAYEVEKRSRVLSDAEIRALWAATDIGDGFGLIIRILLWTGCRRREAGGMRWSEFAGGIWTIPGSRAKNAKPLELPIATQMQEAIAARPRVEGKDTVFGFRSARGYTTWGDAKAKLDDVLKFNEHWVLHSLRATVDTRLASLGIRKEVRDRILNHDISELDESYQHYSFEDEKREALQRWADELDGLSHK
jgi:integrase